MPLIMCPECKKKISDTIEECPQCGFKITAEVVEELQEEQKKLQKKGTIGCLSIIIIVIAFIVYANVSQKNKIKALGPVYNESYDGSVKQVKQYLNANLKDPSSVQYIEWGKVVKTEYGDFVVRVQYRAKNSFGTYNVERKIFALNSIGTITEVVDVP